MAECAANVVAPTHDGVVHLHRARVLTETVADSDHTPAESGNDSRAGAVRTRAPAATELGLRVRSPAVDCARHQERAIMVGARADLLRGRDAHDLFGDGVARLRSAEEVAVRTARVTELEVLVRSPAPDRAVVLARAPRIRSEDHLRDVGEAGIGRRRPTSRRSAHHVAGSRSADL